MSACFKLDLLVIILGAVFGSFATVLTARIPKRQSIVKPPSMCPSCHHQLSVSENIPLFSYFIQRGKCRNCAKNISWRYPVIELSTSLLFIISYLIYGHSIPTLCLFVLATVTLPLVIIDIESRRLPNVLTASAFLIGIALAIVDSILKQSWKPIQYSIVFATLSFAFFLFLNLASRGGMGFGDIKLAAMIGSLLFFMPWLSYVSIYFVAFGTGSLYGIILMIFKKANKKSMIPFGPFILFGAWLVSIVSRNH